jgi:hypothetical protein
LICSKMPFLAFKGIISEKRSLRQRDMGREDPWMW